MESRDGRVLYFLIEVDEGGHPGQAETDADKAVKASGGWRCWRRQLAAVDCDGRTTSNRPALLSVALLVNMQCNHAPASTNLATPVRLPPPSRRLSAST